MTAQELWRAFQKQHQIEEASYDAWAFGADPDGLADLVVRGIKTGTASAYPLYEAENEPIPQVGEYNVILNTRDEAVCITQTTKVYVSAFNLVSAEHAYMEGEGDRSLDYWRKVHRTLFTQWMKEANMEFTEDMPVVCEEFCVVYLP